MNDDLLKDVILSTLAEIEEEVGDIEEQIVDESEQKSIHTHKPSTAIPTEESSYKDEKLQPELFQERENRAINTPEEPERVLDNSQNREESLNEEELFLGRVGEDIETLFLGLSSPDIVSKDEKCNLTVKYLQALSLMINERRDKLRSQLS